MAQSGMRAALAKETAKDHEALHSHRWISALGSPELALVDYAALLGAYHGFISQVHQAVGANHEIAPEAQLGTVVAALARDLKEMWQDHKAPEELRLELAGTPACLGALYVLHGARFGAVGLGRNVADVLPDAPRHYLSGSASAQAWRSALAAIEEYQPDTPQGIEMIAAATDTFRAFGPFVSTFCASVTGRAAPICDRVMS